MAGDMDSPTWVRAHWSVRVRVPAAVNRASWQPFAVIDHRLGKLSVSGG